MRDRPAGSYGDIANNIEEFRIRIRIGECEGTRSTRSHSQVPYRDGSTGQIDDGCIGIAAIDAGSVDISRGGAITVRPICLSRPVGTGSTRPGTGGWDGVIDIDREGLIDRSGGSGIDRDK